MRKFYVSALIVMLVIAFIPIIDLTGITAPDERSLLVSQGVYQAYGVHVDQGYAYVAAGSNGLIVVEVSDPANPGEVIVQDIGGNAFDIFVNGSYAYIASPTLGLVILDSSTPLQPQIILNISTQNGAYDVFVSGQYAYVADYENLVIIDVSDPMNPGQPIYQGTSSRNMGVYVDGNYSYVAGDQCLAIIDVTTPLNPGVPTYKGSSSAEEVFVTNGYAYVGVNTLGLAIINVSDPSTPGEPLYRSTDDNPNGIFVEGNYAYIAAESAGLAIIDISDPTSPGTPVYQTTQDSGYGVFVFEDYAFVADGSNLAIFDVSTPTSPGLPIYPDNPVSIVNYPTTTESPTTSIYEPSFSPSENITIIFFFIAAIIGGIAMIGIITARRLSSRPTRVQKQVKTRRYAQITPPSVIPPNLHKRVDLSGERRPFFCQLDTEQHPSTDSAYQCHKCSRMVCTECYERIVMVGVPKCPYCEGALYQVQ